MPPRRWVLGESEPNTARTIAAELKVRLPIALALVGRGYSSLELAQQFIRPTLSSVTDPLRVPGIQDAVDRLRLALDRRERIVVFGDYDADGVTATALLVRVLRKLGGNVEPFLPHRIDDGYGLSLEAVQKCIAQYTPKLVVTADCGTSAVAAVEHAKALGVDIVVTDHHLPGAAISQAFAVVNPKLGNDPEILDLAGVGVAFKLCHALGKVTRGLTPQELRSYLDLVAVGTIADVVPLRGENRVLCKYGLKQLSDAPCVGLKALREVAGLRGVVNTYHVGFVLGPRLNAAGRLDSANAALRLLLTDSAREAQEWARILDAANRERQAVEQEVYEEAVAQWDVRFDPTKHFALVVDGVGWHPGVIGIVAARLCRRYFRPTIVLSVTPENGLARGSCRSIEGFNVVEHLHKVSDLLERYGGHAMAAGLDIAPERIAEFRERFNAVARESLKSQDLRPQILVDAQIGLGEIDKVFAEQVDLFEPCGVGNPRPRWLVRGVTPEGDPQILREKHIKAFFRVGKRLVRAIGFDMADRWVQKYPMDFVCDVRIDEFGGTPIPLIQFLDIAESDTPLT